MALLGFNFFNITPPNFLWFIQILNKYRTENQLVCNDVMTKAFMDSQCKYKEKIQLQVVICNVAKLHFF